MLRTHFRFLLVAVLALGIGVVAVNNVHAGDPIPPSIEAITPSTAVAGTPVTLTAFRSNIPESSTEVCRLIVNGEVKEYMSPVGTELALNGDLTVSYTFASPGTYTVKARCFDYAFTNGLVVNGTETSLTVTAASSNASDTTAPTIGDPTPLTATALTATTISVSYSDTGSGVATCSLLANQTDGTPHGSGPNVMTRTGTGTSGTASFTLPAIFTGNYSLIVSCTDVSGNTNTVSRTVVVSSGSNSSDTTAPTVSVPSPLTATVGAPVTFSVSYSDSGSGVTGCYLNAHAGNGSGGFENLPMTRVGNGASGTASYTISASWGYTSNYTIAVYCVDLSGNSTPIVNRTVTLSPASGAGTDVTAPTVGAVTPLTALKNTAATFSASYADSVSVASCAFFVNGSNAGTMTRSNSTSQGTASVSYTFSNTGSYDVRAECTDSAGNRGIGSTATVTVTAGTAGSDVTVPVVGAVSAATVVANTAGSVSVSYSDAVGVTNCYLYMDSTSLGAMTRSSSATQGTATMSYTLGVLGTHTARVECVDAAGNRGIGANGTITIVSASANAGTDLVTPVVSAVTPITAVVNAASSFYVSASDAVGVMTCYLYADSVSLGSMTRSSGTALNGIYSRSYAFTTSGNHTARVECVDAAGNRGIGSSTTVAVSAAASTGTDTTVPVVGSITPTQVIGSLPVTATLSSTVSDNSGVFACYLYVSSVSVGGMLLPNSTALISGVVTKSYTFSTAGTYTVRAECVDQAGNRGVGPNTTLTVSATGVNTGTDTTAPVISALVYNPPISTGVLNRYSVSVSDNRSVSVCYLYANGSLLGTMSLSNGNTANTTASVDYAFISAGNYVVRAECIDGAGNRAVGPSSTVTAYTNGSSTNNTNSNPNGPNISTVYPSAVGTNAETSYAITFNANSIGVNGCSFYVNGVYTGAMGLSGSGLNGAANYRHIFSSPGTYQVHAECVDERGGRGIGPTTNVSVTPDYVQNTTPAVPGTVYNTLPPQGSLVKLVCPDGADNNHPCKAVYFYGRDGMRHAFPHERVFFTWYGDFSTVVEVTQNVMASIPLGANATYRPGVRMLKFRSVPQVYAVGHGGVLRWITTAELAATFYGSNWAQNVHDLPDAYYSNYTFGDNISSAADYNPTGEMNRALTIDANL